MENLALRDAVTPQIDMCFYGVAASGIDTVPGSALNVNTHPLLTCTRIIGITGVLQSSCRVVMGVDITCSLVNGLLDEIHGFAQQMQDTCNCYPCAG